MPRKKRKLAVEVIGDVDVIGWEPNKSGKSTDLFAVIKVNLGSMKKENQKEEAETRIKGLKDQLLGRKVQLFVVD